MTIRMTFTLADESDIIWDIRNVITPRTHRNDIDEEIYDVDKKEGQ